LQLSSAEKETIMLIVTAKESHTQIDPRKEWNGFR
jgi:hypothetical protein